MNFRNLTFTALLLAATTFTSCKTQKPKLTEAQLQQLFHSMGEENLKPTRWDQGSTTTTNEDRLDLYIPHIQNLGGAYVGVGSIQNFTLAAWAKVEYLILVDFTRIVPAANKVHIAFLNAAKTPDEFKALWSKKKDKIKEATEIIQKFYAGNQGLKFILKSFNKARYFLNWRFKNDAKLLKKRSYKTWLFDNEQYSFLRSLAQRKRIIALQGDLRGTKTLQGISATLKKMKVPIGIFYTSNAEEYFHTYSQNYRDNVLSLPSNKKSLIVRTLSVRRAKYPWAPDSHYTPDNGFHYNLQDLDDFQNDIRSDAKASVIRVMTRAKVDRKNGFSEIRRTAFVNLTKSW